MDRTRTRRNRPRASALWGLIIAAVAVIAVIWIAAESADDTLTTGPGEMVDHIADHPEAYEGTFVTLRGEVAQVVGPSTFVIQDDDPLFNERLLVIDTTGELLTLGELGEDDEVQVSGNLHVFELARVERDFELDLEHDLHIEWVGRPVLMATSVSQQVAAR